MGAVDPAKRAEYMRRYRARHPEVEAARSLRPEQRERHRLAKRRLRATPEGARKNREAVARYRTTTVGKEQNRRTAELRRARLAGAPVVDFAPERWVEVQAEYEHRCAYCGHDGELTQDHVVPLSRGGSHTRDNIVPACRRCNTSKGSKLLAEWYGFRDAA